MIYSLCFGFFLLSVLTCTALSLNIIFTMPPLLISCLRLLFDFVFALLEILLKMIYILLLFICNIFGDVMMVFYKVSPYIYIVSSRLFSVFVWIITHIVRGILGIGDKATNALSWVFVLSAAFLYFDNKYWKENRMPQNADNLQNNAPGVDNQHEEIERNIIVHREEEHDSDLENSQHSDLTDSEDENEQVDLENRENENEVNIQQEADHLRMRGDNERNINVERNRLPNVQRNIDVFENISRNRLPNVERNQSGNAEGNRLPNVQQELERRTQCCICFERERSVAVFPCGHTHMCLECVQNVQRGNGRCPMCQRQIEEYRQVFF